MTDSRRLVVELSKRAFDDLAAVVESEEVNRTIAVHRALRVFRLLTEAQVAGKRLQLVQESTGQTESVWVA